MPYTDDPIRDFERHDAEQNKWLNSLPRCCKCDERIQEDDLFDVYGDLYCWDCAIKLFRKDTDNYINNY